MKDVKSNKPKWPSEKRRRAVDLGPLELMNLVEWQFRHRPVALRNCRTLFEKRPVHGACIACHRNGAAMSSRRRFPSVMRDALKSSAQLS
jgi:hypothetical protein